MEQMSPLLQARLEQQQAYQTQNNTNPFVSNPRVDIGGAKLEQLDKDTVSLSSNNNGKIDYSIDDGKISFSDKLKNFGKGLISPITNIFSSPKNFLIGAGIIAAGAALTIATGGAIAPLFVALGVTGGAIQLGISIYKASKATTDDEARQAYQGIGAGTSAVGMSVLGSKAALKGAGVDTKEMNFLKATVECFRQVPSSVSKSVGAFTSGQALTNLKNVFKPKRTANTETNSETKPETKTEAQQEPEVKQNAESKPETKVKAQAEQSKAPEAKETKCKTKVEPKAETNKATAEPKSETPEVKSEIKETTAEAKTEQLKITKTKVKTETEQSVTSESKAESKIGSKIETNSNSANKNSIKTDLISDAAKSKLPSEIKPTELIVGDTEYDAEFGELMMGREDGSFKKLFFGQLEESGNVVVNKYLRTGKNTSKRWSISQIEDVVSSAHDMMNKIKLQHDTILYRGVQDFNNIPEVGEIYTDKGFFSTSADRQLARCYGKNLIKIIAPKGTKCIPDPSYAEILLNSGSKFKILSKSDNLIEMLLLD